LKNLGVVLEKEGKLAEAKALKAEVLACQRRTLDGLMKTGTSDTPGLLRKRGFQLAELGQWKEAAADLTRLRDSGSSDDLAWLGLAALLVQVGDVAAYREHCRKALEQFGRTASCVEARRISKACLILSSADVDMAVTHLGATALTVQTNDADGLAWAQFVNGLLEYRLAALESPAGNASLGRFVGAAQWAQHALDGPKKAYREIEAKMVLAMAQWKLGQPGLARATLAEGSGITGGEDWLDGIIATALTREAKALIEDGNVPTAASAR
jgi:hypothetical protein